MWLSVNSRFKFSSMLSMNVRKVLVCIEQMHGECMIILKVGINLFVTWNFVCSCVEGKEDEIVNLFTQLCGRDVQSYQNEHWDIIILIVINRKWQQGENRNKTSSQFHVDWTASLVKWSHVLGDQMILNSKNYVDVCKHGVEYDLRKASSNNIWK